MRIQMEKRKGGVYAQWFEVWGYNSKGRYTRFLIYWDQAKNYAEAVRFWNKTWGNTCKAIVLRNAEPFSEANYLAA